MRLIHTSDWHLGHELHGFDRALEHEVFLDWLTQQLSELNVDALIVTGDIYDTVNPSILAQKRLYRFLSRALQDIADLEIIIIGGNHDSAARLELPQALLDEERIHLIGGMPRHQGQPDPASILIPLHDNSGTPAAVCAAVPYLRPGDLPTTTEGNSAIKALYHAVIAAADEIRGNLPLVITGHLHMSGGAVSELSERRIVVGGEEAVSSDIFPSSVAYAALGHLHKPQSVKGQTTIRYAGSPFPMSVTEKDYQHSVVMIDLDAKGLNTELLSTPRTIAFHRVPRFGAAPLQVVEDELQQLELEDPGKDRWPFLEVAVQLSSAEPDLRRRIENALEGKPVRLTRIVRQTAGQGGALADGVEQVLTLSELKPSDVFTRCHIDKYGGEPADDLQQAFGEVLDKVFSSDEESATST